MKQYVECDVCNTKIYFGDTFYEFYGMAGVYCSPECFCKSTRCCRTLEMNAKQASDHWCEIFEED